MTHVLITGGAGFIGSNFVRHLLRAETGVHIVNLGAGTHESLVQAANFVQAIQDRQGLMISCLEEIASRLGYIDRRQLLALAEALPSGYGQHLRQVAALATS
jgi:glucose-1-phosphate thymidylyltransferase